jgi:diguanylate cyclase (GGDEF)-like protein/putative nucleotidyltransferase with HDIG domain
MNPWAIIPLVSFLAYITLLILVLQQGRTRANTLFAMFLFASGAWSISAFMLTYNTSASTQPLIFWNNMVFVGVIWSIVSYYHFIRAYDNRPAGIVAYAGYAFALTTLALSFFGLVIRDAYMVGNYLYHDVGPWATILMVTIVPLLAFTMFMLVRRYRRSRDPVDRNRILYLMVGWGLVSFYSPINANIPLLALLPTDHIATLANALIIAYAIGRYQLLDIKFVVRIGLGNIVFLTGIGGLYTGAILLALSLLPGQIVLGTVVAVAIVTLLLGPLARPARLFILERVDRLFYRGTYQYRQVLLGFSSKMGNILNLNDLANEMLLAINQALHLTRANLLFQDTDSGDFTTQFTYPKVKGELTDELRFNADNPIIAWMDKKGSHLSPEQLESAPEFKGLWQVEKEQLIKASWGLFYPVKSRGKLIGILALGRKRSGRLYSHEDIQLVMTIANQAGIIIENAQLYTQATIRANTDGLTGLYNHRHFHERLDQEIARGSRFGNSFSLIMLDADAFKTYNDTHGHVAGDDVLRKIAMYINMSVRNLDMAFRYGGDEFAVILPEAKLSDAYNVAERIRKTIAAKTSSMATPITVSLGIANWPDDGVMRKEIISRADAALYRAKQLGTNRTYLSSEVTDSAADPISIELEARSRALSIIYALAATVDAKDHYTYGHSKKVSDYAMALAEALGLSQGRIATMRAAGLLHDIGKVGIPDAILNKKGPLTEEEWKPIKAHPKLGVEILRHVMDLAKCLPAILHHHEHYNGGGYLSGLKGDNIPLEARILSIADAYDAITSPRPYHPELSSRQAVNELRRCAGTQFDPEMVSVFCKMIEQTHPKRLEIK